LGGNIVCIYQHCESDSHICSGDGANRRAAGREVPAPPPVEERRAPNRRPQLRLRQGDEELYAPGGRYADRGASAAAELPRIRRAEAQRRRHVANAAEQPASIVSREITMELVAGFEEALAAVQRRLEISAVEKAELLGLLKVRHHTPALLSQGGSMEVPWRTT
jgi:hypothetical protein